MGMHGFLVLILVIGSAFFVSEEKRESRPPIRVIPTRLIDGETSGGGNPDVPITSDTPKGNSLTPVPAPVPAPDVPKPPTPKPPDPVAPAPPVVVKPPPPRVEPKRAEPVVKPTPVKPVNDSLLKEIARPTPNPLKPAFDPLKELKPIKQTQAEQVADAKARAEAEARSTAAAEARERAAAGQRIAKNFGKAIKELQAGFATGTTVDIGGPGGEAFANYADWVKTRYENDWRVPDSLMDDDSTAKVTVTIGRNGNVISARIQRRSGNSTLDQSVQRTLNAVKFIAPFPKGTTDESRTFTINFNLKAKRSAG